jgi:hypothetical protein
VSVGESGDVGLAVKGGGEVGDVGLVTGEECMASGSRTRWARLGGIVHGLRYGRSSRICTYYAAVG